MGSFPGYAPKSRTTQFTAVPDANISTSYTLSILEEYVVPPYILRLH